MRKYSDSIVIKFDTSATGNAGSGKPVTVYDVGTIIKAFLFEDDQVTPLANPVFADDEGNYSFTVADGVYDLVIDEGLLTETRITKVQIANIIIEIDENTFQKFRANPLVGESIINTPITFKSVGVLAIDGVFQFETDFDFEFDGDLKTITMLKGFTFTGDEVVEYGLNSIFLFDPGAAGAGIGKISNYLNPAKTNFGAAIEQCCLENHIVDLEGLTLSTEDSITITAPSKVKEVWFNGADISILSSHLEYQGFFPEHKGPGNFRGGSLLKQVAVESGSDTNIIELTNVDGLKVGDFVNSSLDIFYLPNATDRVGFIDEGDFNRIVSINTLTKEITLSYNFLRTALYTVSSGLLQNSWIGINTTFNSAGIHSTSAEHQDLLFTSGLTFSNWAGYVAVRVDQDLSINDVGSRLIIKDCKVENQFLDIWQLRGLDVITENYTITRQYDFAKQHFVLNQPTHGRFTTSGNNWKRENLDHEIYNSGMGIDAEASFGIIHLDGTSVFDGSQPVDLPTSDYSIPPSGQLFFGINVPIFDCFHFYAPAGDAGAVGGSFKAGQDVFTRYSRSIFGTLISAATQFEYSECVFEGTQTSCEPIFVNVAGKGSDQLLEDYKATLIGGKYFSRNDTFCRGVSVDAYNIKIELTSAARITPQVDGQSSLNNVNMRGGLINGRYKIDSNYPIFRDVHLAYQGTANLDDVVLFSIDTLDASSNFILDVPEDFEGTGNDINEWDDVLPISAWFGSNASGFAPTPNVKFRIAGRSNGYVFGNNSGKQYLQEIAAAKSIAPPSPTIGKFSAKLDIGDSIIGMADKTELIVNQTSQHVFTTNAAGVGASSDIIVSVTPTFAPTHITVYSDAASSWESYTVANQVGTTITPNENIKTEFFVGDKVYLISAAEVSTGGIALLSTKVRRDVDLTVPVGNPATEVPFEATVHDELTGSWTIGTPERLTVPAGVSRVDVSATARYILMLSGTATWIRINHFNSVSTLLDTVGANQNTVGQTAHRASTTALDVDVTPGDYFVMNVIHNDAVTIPVELNSAFFSMRKVK